MTVAHNLTHKRQALLDDLAELEFAVLAAAISCTEGRAYYLTYLNSKSFFNNTAKAIALAVDELREASDLITVTSWLRDKPELFANSTDYKRIGYILGEAMGKVNAVHHVPVWSLRLLERSFLFSLLACIEKFIVQQKFDALRQARITQIYDTIEQVRDVFDLYEAVAAIAQQHLPELYDQITSIKSAVDKRIESIKLNIINRTDYHIRELEPLLKLIANQLGDSEVLNKFNDFKACLYE